MDPDGTVIGSDDCISENTTGRSDDNVVICLDWMLEWAAKLWVHVSYSVSEINT